MPHEGPEPARKKTRLEGPEVHETVPDEIWLSILREREAIFFFY
jgi:hypothetical protein